MTAEEITAALGGKWNAEKRTGQAKCPAHEDRHPSLSVSEKAGRLLVHCHKGCPQTAVIDALVGLQCWPESSPTWEMPANGAQTAVNGTATKREVASYDYRDEAGTLVFQTVRFEPKTFRQRRPDGQGGWLWNLEGVRLVLYRLPELLAADPQLPVYIVEGEKDADSLAALGLVATTSPMGAKKWRTDYNAWLQGRTVVLVPDHDKAGEEHVDQVARELAPVAAQVRVVHLPDLVEKGDVSDWLAAGGNRVMLEALVSTTAPSSMPEPRYPIQSLAALVEGREERGAQVVEGILWAARVTWAFSDPATGKTLFLLAALMHVADGRAWFCDRAVQAGPVLVIEEDSPLSVIAEYVETLADIYDFDLEHLPMWINRGQGLRLTDAEGIALVQETIAACPQLPKVVLLDACERLVPSDKFNTKELDALTRLLQWMTTQGITPIVIDHTNRTRQEKGKTIKPMERLFGARAKSAISDAMLYMEGTLSSDGVQCSFAKFRGEMPAPFAVLWNQETGFSIPDRPVLPQTSKGEKVRRWFERHPGEWFSQAQVSLGTDVKPTTAKRWLQDLVKERWLLMKDATPSSPNSYCLNPQVTNATDGFGA